MNTSGNGTAQQCTGPSSWATESNWDQNNSGVTALQARVHYHHNNSSNNNNSSSSGSTTSSSHTANRVGWEWDQSTMLMSHERNQGQGIGTDPGKEAATLINSGIRSSYLDGLFPYGHPHMAPLFPANTSLRSCFPSHGIHLLGGMGDVVKQESVHGGFSRIGLSLGGTYFSSEDGGVGLGRLVKRARGNTPGSQVAMCQAEGCRADLSSAKHYHRRHKVCEQHSKAAIVLTGGQNQRFCQQCSRFHLLSEFDDGKRSCRKRLADHNRRRRKPQSNVNNDVPRSANGEPTASSKEDLQDSSTNNQSTGTQANSMSGSDSQAPTPAISLAPPVSLMIQNTITTNNSDKNHHSRRQMPMVSGSTSTQDPIYHYIHVTNPQTGPNLSLSSSLVGIPIEEYQWRQQVPQGSKKYESNEQSSVPWLRHQGSELVSPSPLNLQPPSVLRTRSSENSASSNGSSSQIFSSIQSSRSGLSSSANWVMGTGTTQRNRGGKDHGHCNTNFGVVSGINVDGNLEGQQVLSLLECSSTFRDGEGTARQQQTSSSETESTSTGTGTGSGSGTGTGQQQGGDHVKFQLPDLHALRPFAASHSIYDANTSLL